MLVVGAVFVDVKGFARDRYKPEERNVGDVQVVAGGVSRNVAENLTRLGLPVQFASMVDDNGMGREVCDELSTLGVDTTHVLSTPNGMGMWLAILDESGNLAGSISRQPDFSALEAYLKANGDAIMAGADAVVLEMDTSAARPSRTSRPMALSSTMLTKRASRPSFTRFSATLRQTPPAVSCTSPTLRSSGW